MADEFISGNARDLDPAGRGDFSWSGDSAASIFDGLFNFATSTFDSAVQWYGTDKAYELDRLRVTTAYDDRNRTGLTSSNMQTFVVLALVGVGAFLLIKAVK